MTLAQAIQDIVQQAAINSLLIGLIIGITGAALYAYLPSYRGKV